MPHITESISKSQARKLVLLSQQLPPFKANGKAVDATLSAIEHLGYIQVDTISVIQRAHHHTLWNRNPRYQPVHIDQLQENKKIFEYWSHAASYLPMCDYRYSLVRKHEIASGIQKHWFEKDEPIMSEILRRIEQEGPLMARDFEIADINRSGWTSHPIKRALNNLFMQGELMIPFRKEFHKVYDLTHRVLPADTDTSLPDEKEYARYLIDRFLKANGLGQAPEITYLLRNIKPMVADTLREMLESEHLMKLKVGKTDYYAQADALEMLNKPLARSQAKILSPFDNLLIQRKRMLALFDFDYQLECYLPANRRQYGYFALPVLWDGKLVARMDCKAERKKSVFHIRSVILEPGLKKYESFARALSKELRAFMRFNECNMLKIHQSNPPQFIQELEQNMQS
ncbi:winged helix-turn-helix domain-containing protein [Carboxylicivirga sp. RSCT41]|uniref:winged helix-turn-helix domain-containing protein n=1 Tax=Carboxylicivirga agarovorans TaxID=3417570 RepID=UPI003D3419A5